MEQALVIFKEILESNKTSLVVEYIKFIITFYNDNDLPSINYKDNSCITNTKPKVGPDILIITLINLIFNMIMTLGLLHCIEVINIYDLVGISDYYFIDCDDLNYNTSCNYEIISQYKPVKINYFISTLDILKNKNKNKNRNKNKNKTFYTITSDCKPHIINTLDNFYDVNSHFIKNNNSLLEQVNNIKTIL